MPMKIPATLLAATFSVALATGSGVAVAAAGYPDRPVRLIVPFAPGGSTDVLARVLGQKLGEKLGQPFLIDNRAGAGGTIGTAIAAISTRAPFNRSATTVVRTGGLSLKYSR